MSLVVILDVFQPICFECPRKTLRDVRRINRVISLTGTYITDVVVDAAAFAQAVIVFLLVSKNYSSEVDRRKYWRVISRKRRAGLESVWSAR